MTKLIIVRHCQAQGNLERFFQGNIDTDITPKGREQIDKTARMLSAEPIDIFYTSYKKRAIKTMEGINLYHNVPVVNDERLILLCKIMGAIIFIHLFINFYLALRR